MTERKAMEGTLEPLEEEEVGEEEEGPVEVIWVKLPNGKKMAMVAPYDDEGDVKWLVPRDPRDLDYFEIPWDLLIDEKYRQNQRGRLVVVSSQPVDEDWLNRISDGEPHPEAIYKSRYDTFNGRHIIEALLSKKIPEPPKPENLGDKVTKGKKKKKGEDEEGKETEGEEDEDKEKEDDDEDDDMKTESATSKVKKKPEPPKEQKSPKELLLLWANDMRKSLVHNLIEKIREKQHVEEEKAPRVIKWMTSAIKREEKVSAMKKARKERMRRMRAGFLKHDPAKSVHGESGEEIVAEERDQTRNLDLTSLDVKLPEEPDLDLDRSVTDPSIQRSLDRLAEDDEGLISGFGEEEEDMEKITFDDLEAEENFLKKIKRRAAREKKKRYREMARTLKKLRKQLEDKCTEIAPPPEYFEAVDEVLRGDEEDLFDGWEPMLVVPRDFCLALPASSGRWFDCTCDTFTCSGAPSRFPKECIRHCECREKKGAVTFTFKGEPFAVSHTCGRVCKCQKYDISRGNQAFSRKSNSASPGMSNETDPALEKKYRPRGCLLEEDFSDSDQEASDAEDSPEFRHPADRINSIKETVNEFRTVSARDRAAFRRYLRSGKDSDQVPKHERERDCPSPFSLKPFERKSLYTKWLEKQKTIVDRIVMNENTAKSAYIRGWIKSPYYQFGVDSGLLMPPVDKEDEERIAKFKRSPGYEAKYNEYGKILEEGLFSEEKTQELVVLGVAHTDPFLKDFLDFTKTERDINESLMMELQALVEEDPDAYAQLMPLTLINEDEEEEEENEDGNWKQKEQDKALWGIIDERLNSDPDHWKGTKTKQFSTFWDEKDFLRRSIIKEKRRKELTGDLPLTSHTDEESLKKLFIRNLDKIWVHPENFKKFLSTNNWKPGKPETKELYDFGEFLKGWRNSWIGMVNSVRDAAGEQRKRRLYGRMVRRSKMFVKAFSRRLEEYKIIGEPQPFLVERLGREDKEKRSYLTYLKKMRRAYVKHRKIDKKKIESALNCLEGILETIDAVKEQKSETKIPSPEEENMDEEEGEPKQKSKTNLANIHPTGKEFKLMFNKLYTSKDLARGDFSKGPVIVDKELIDMDAQQVKDLYKKHNISLENAVDPFVVYNEWRGFFPAKKKAEFTCAKVHCGLKPKRTNAVTHYMSLLHAARLIEDDPYDMKFSPKKFRHYVQPISDVMKCVDFSLLRDVIRGQPKPPKQQKQESDDVNKSQVFNEDILNAWRALKMPMIDRLTPAESRTVSRETLSKASSHKVEDVESMKSKSVVPVDPYYCKKVRAWKRVIYDPYACLRALPRVGKRERSWYRSALEREMRAFRRKNKSFLKYLDMNKLKKDPDNFKVWKMIASGSLFCKYVAVTKERTSQDSGNVPVLTEPVDEKSNQNGAGPDGMNTRAFRKAVDDFKMTSEFKTIERMFGDGELWNWDMIGVSNNDPVESIYLDELMGFKTKHSRKNNDVLEEGEEDEKKQKVIKHIQKVFKHSLPDSCEGVKHLKRPKKDRKPENFVVFTTVKLPPFADRPEQNTSRAPVNVDQKVEDRKLFKLLRSCGTLVFDTTRSRHDMHICSWYLRKLYIKMERVEQKWQTELQTKRNTLSKDLVSEVETKAQDHRLCDIFRPKQHIILITSFVSWASSPPNVKTHINEKNFWKRKPHQDYYDYYTFENLLYRIGKYMPFNLRATIVYSGLPFGCEEDGLSYVFKMAYENKREIPIYGPGNNYPPMVHITDLSKVIASLVLPEYYLPMTCLVQPIKLSLKRRVYNIANQVSYAHVRTQPTSYYEWNNILPKSIHDMLQLDVRAADVDLHEFMGSPTIAKPFSAGSRGYQLFQELTQTRGTHCRSVILLGPPNVIKSDLAKTISVFYGIPLVTRTNILSEWLKLKRLILEGKALRKSYHKTAVPEEGEKDDVPKRPQFGPDEMKFVVSDRNNCDVNRNWLLFTLKFILRTKRYRRVGYVLCDMPMSEKDADFLFNNKNREPDPREFRNVSMFVRLPDKVIKVETDLTDFHGGRSFAQDPIQFDDMNDYYRLQAKGKGAEAFFQKRLVKIHRVNVQDDFLLEKVIDIVGPPPRPGGAQMYLSMMSRTINDDAAKGEQKKEAAYTQHFFEQMQEKGLDLAPGLTEQCIPSLQSLTKLNLYKTLQPYYVGYRHYDTTKNTSRSNAGPFREIRRKWAQKSSFFNHMPTDGNRIMWKKARRYWAPLSKTKEYITQFEVTEMKKD